MKGDFVFLRAADGSDGGIQFAVYDSRTRKKVFEDADCLMCANLKKEGTAICSPQPDAHQQSPRRIDCAEVHARGASGLRPTHRHGFLLGPREDGNGCEERQGASLLRLCPHSSRRIAIDGSPPRVRFPGVSASRQEN